MRRIISSIHNAAFGAGLFLMAATLAAAPPATVPTAVSQVQVDQLIQRLGAEDAQARQAAKRQLIGMGTAVRPAIRKALENGLDPEARARAEAVLREIDRDDPNIPTLVTLEYKRGDLRDILADLAAQGGVSIQVDPEEGPLDPVSIDVHDEPFWVALLDVCKKGKLYFPDWGNEGYIRLRQGRGNDRLTSPFVQQDGPFLIMLTGLGLTYDRSFIGGGFERGYPYFTISLSILLDPKIHQLYSSYGSIITEAVDDKGNSLLRHRSGPNQTAHGSGNWEWRMNFNHVELNYPAHPGKTIAHLKGVFPTLLATRWVTEEISNPLKAGNVTRRVGRYQFTLKSFKKVAPDGYSYEFAARDTETTFDRLPMDGTHFIPGLGITIIDVKGRPLATEYMNRQQPSRKGYVGAEPAKLILMVATKWEQRDITFEFKAVPMP